MKSLSKPNGFEKIGGQRFSIDDDEFLIKVHRSSSDLSEVHIISPIEFGYDVRFHIDWTPTYITSICESCRVVVEFWSKEVPSEKKHSTTYTITQTELKTLQSFSDYLRRIISNHNPLIKSNR